MDLFNYSVVEEFLKRFLCLFGRRKITFFSCPITNYKIEVFAKIRSIFFDYWFCSSLFALMCNSGIIKYAISANTNIFITIITTFTTSRLSVEFPFFSTLVTVFSHKKRLIGISISNCLKFFV